MRKLIVAAIMVVGMTAFAQVGKQGDKPTRPMEKFTPEQRTQLELKKMTLDLDLNANQQKEMGKIIAEQQSKREAKRAEMEANKKSNVKLTPDQLFAMKSQRLDEEIATKDKVKKILTPEQLQKWDAMREKHEGMQKHRMEKRERKGVKAKE